MEKTTSTTETTNPQIIFSWVAPARPYKKRNPRVIRFYIALCFLLSAIVFFFGDYILMLPLWASLFIFYVITVTPPPEVTNKITMFGIESAHVIMHWEDLHHFYFSQRFGSDVLTLVTHAPYFVHIYLVVPSERTRDKLKELLSQHLVYQENPKLALSDRAINAFAKLLPDE